MADAQDSKSCGGNLVWVQVPPPAFDVNSLENSKEFFCKFGCIYLRWEMYQIGICDDGKNTCAFIEDVVLKYGKKRNVKMDIQVWNSGEELCAYLETGKQLDILYLDIELFEVSGIDAGIFIRKQMENHTMQIIYISGKQSYAQQLFKVQPMDFLVKPIEEEKIEETLALALKIVGLCVFFAGIVIPQILLIAFRRRLFDEPDERKIHQCVVPRLGGMAFKPVVFFSFVLLLAVNVSTGHDELLKEIGAEALPLAYAFCAIIMLYLVGIADDLIGVRYRAKFFIQIVCGIMLVAGGVELSDLHGMLFIHSMPSWISIPLTVFVTVFIINAINLIDGIDGLASGLCSIAFLFYGMTFIWFHQYLYAMLAFATLGVLIPFYYYKEIYIETERIIIRNFKQKDAEGLLEYLSHPRVNCFAGDRLCSREAAWAYMQYSPKDMLRYAVSLKKDDFIIGDVFALRENEDTYNVGWHFNKRFEGKGFACEAAAGLLDYLFREAGARRIYGFVEDDNIRSKRLCERLGMRREGCFKEFVTFVNNPDGSPKYEDTCVYAILEKEWNTIRQW